jgi:cyclopropane-fatty-acyl-phospholipid synthase
MTDPVFALEPDIRATCVARWLLFRLLSGIREGSLTVREGAQTFILATPPPRCAPRRGSARRRCTGVC